MIGAVAAIILLAGSIWLLILRKGQDVPVQENAVVQAGQDVQEEVSEKDVAEPEEPSDQPEAPQSVEPEAPASQWPVMLSLEEAASLTVVVNKKHKLPSEYVPALTAVAGGNMRPEAASALQQLLGDADAAGVPMIIVSSYRSYANQVSTYNYWVRVDGKVQADRSSARPGHSEHQTGLAVDLGNPDGSCELLICFGTTPAGQWLAVNAANYGFIIRYPDGKESATGYQYEPWHLRYLGADTAKAIVGSGQTMDEYYGIEAGDY